MEPLYEGKSKSIYPGTDDTTYTMRYRNTATAFNGEKREELEGKAVLNCAISNLIYKYLMSNGVKTHLVKVVDDTTVIVKRAQIVPVEVIVRNVAAGSFSKKYGVPEGTELKNTILEFSLKSDELGDPMINESQITAAGFAEQAELDDIKAQTMKINTLLTGLFAKAGIKLIDFKLEFGRTPDGIILCDEISPDSCRLWDAKTNEKMDKDRFRRNLGSVMEGYQHVLDRLKKAIND